MGTFIQVAFIEVKHWKSPKYRTIREWIEMLLHRDFPGGAVVKNPPANAGDTGPIPGPGRSHVPQLRPGAAKITK